MLLVGLAACISMIQVNLLLPVRGKAPDSFVVMDLMRLPLGILSGMGFIGAGAILHKDNLVVGVTTAATLWFTTVIGLCLGGGQIALGLVALGLGLVVLWLLKPVESWWKQDKQADLTVVATTNGPSEEEVTSAVLAAGFRIASMSVTLRPSVSLRELHCKVNWQEKAGEIKPPPFVTQFASRKDTLTVSWNV
jgi:putative Mg2+ transporter-C (MgtC) family protein